MPAFDRRPEDTADLDPRWITVPLATWIAAVATVAAVLAVQPRPEAPVAAEADPAVEWTAA